MVPLTGFAAGGSWAGLGIASALIAVLAALVVTVITLVNRIERQAGSILDNLTATGVATRPLLVIVEANVHLDALAGKAGDDERDADPLDRVPRRGRCRAGCRDPAPLLTESVKSLRELVSGVWRP
jgi:hypothetical protein